MLKTLQVRLQHFVNWEFQNVQAGFKNAKKSEIKLPTSVASSKKQESSRKKKKIYFRFIDYTKAFDFGGSQQTVENSSRGGNTTPDFSWEICMLVKR